MSLPLVEMLCGKNAQFQFIDSFNQLQHPLPDFPGNSEASKQGLAFDLPKLLSVTIHTPSAKTSIEFSYTELIEYSAMDQNICSQFEELIAIQQTLDSVENRDYFAAELNFIIIRFLMHYKPSGVELYEAVRRMNLSCAVLWELFHPKWRTWAATLNEQKTSPSWMTILVLVIYNQRELQRPAHNLVDVIDGFRFGANRYGKGHPRAGYMSAVQLAKAKDDIERRISTYKFIKDVPSGIPTSSKVSDLAKIEAGIEFTVDEVVLNLTIVDIVECAIGVVKPEILNEHGYQNDMELYNILRSLSWEYLILEPLSFGTVSHLLYSFKILDHYYHIFDLKVMEYYRPKDISNDSMNANTTVSILIPFIVLNGLGTPKAYTTYA